MRHSGKAPAHKKRRRPDSVYSLRKKLSALRDDHAAREADLQERLDFERAWGKEVARDRDQSEAERIAKLYERADELVASIRGRIELGLQ